MISAFRLLWKNYPYLTVGFLFAIALTVFFGVRMVLFWVYWADPAHQNQPPAGWMTPGYVAQSWHIPREDMAQILDLPPPNGRPPTLRDIANQRGIPLQQLIVELEQAITAHQDTHD